MRDSWIMQCSKCYSKWPPGIHLRKNGTERTTCPICNSRSVLQTGYLVTDLQYRDDLLMLTDGKYPVKYRPETTAEEIDAASIGKFIVEHRNGTKMFVSRGWVPPDEGHYVYLTTNGRVWMTSCKEERDSILWSVDQCPEDAEVFIAGLGLGIVLLYLAKSRKAKNVIVAEYNPDVIAIVEPRVRRWLDKRFPEFTWEVVYNDAIIEIQRRGLFDWIFFDIWKNVNPSTDEIPIDVCREYSQQHLTDRGVFTAWPEVMQDMWRVYDV